MSEKLIQRYTPPERANHWVVAIAFILLALSGLALFHPSLYWLSSLFGGGPWMRILHPFIGVVLALSFVALSLRLWRFNRMTKDDEQWLCQIGDVMRNRDSKLPEAGRFNAGQKLLFYVMAACVALLLLSGIVIWRPWFAGAFPIVMVRLGAVVHALSAFILIAGIIVHIYAAIWVKGSVRAMVRGTVPQAWAKKHHPAWYRETTGGSR